MNRKKSLTGLIHITVITVILFVPYLLNIKSLDDFERLFLNPFALRYFISFGLLIGFTYLNYLRLVPKLYLNRKFLIYTVWIVSSLSTVLYLPEGIAYLLNFQHPIQDPQREIKNIPNDKKPDDFDFNDRRLPPPTLTEYQGAFAVLVSFKISSRYN